MRKQRATGVRGLAALVGAAAIAAGCAGEEVSVRGTPLIAGNTFDRHNALDVIYPDAQRINVSYQFAFEHRIEVAVPGAFAGPAWLFRERPASAPERFVLIHLAQESPAFEPPKGQRVTLGQTRFITVDRCLSDWRATSAGAQAADAAASYAGAVAAAGYPLSRDLFVSRYIARKPDSTGRRTDIVVVRDIQRAGYDCRSLENVQAPGDSEGRNLLESLREDAGSTFEIIG